METSPIPARDQLRVLPLTSLLTPHCSRGMTGETLLVHSPQFCSIKVAFTSPKTEQFGRSSERKPWQMKDKPQNTTSSPQLDSSSADSLTEERAKTVVSTSLDRQKSSSAQLGDRKRLKELGPFHAKHVFFFLFFSVNEATNELGMIAARTRQNMRVHGADASWE